MNRLPGLPLRLRRAVRRRAHDRDMAAEMRDHIAQETARRIAAGEDPATARRRAAAAFGSLDARTEEVRDTRLGSWLDEAVRNLRYATRSLLRAPLLTTVAVGSLALGIGGTTAVFTLVNRVLLQPSPYADPDRVVLVTLENRAGTPSPASPRARDVVEWTRQSQSVLALAGYDWTFNFLIKADGSESVQGQVASASFFEVTGLTPEIGRTFQPHETSVEESPVVVLGYELWQTHFGSDPGILGQTVRLGQLPPLTVVGVMPPAIRFLPSPNDAREPNYDLQGFVDYWLPGAPDAAGAADRSWNIVGRLRPGVSLAEAQTVFSTVVARQPAADARPEETVARLTPVMRVLDAEVNRLLLPLSGAVAFVLLISIANVAGLLLVRGLARQSELAIRAALGAGSRQLHALALTESLLVAALGGGLGVVAAFAAVHGLPAWMPGAVPRTENLAIDGRVLLFTLAVTLLAGIATGVMTARQVARPAVNRILREGGRGSTAAPAQRRLLGMLVSAEVALTLILLIGAGLMVRTLFGLGRVQAGFSTEGTLAMVVTLLGDDQAALHRDALQRVSGLPGVRFAAFAWGVPLTGHQWARPFSVSAPTAAGEAAPTFNAAVRSVSSDYLALLGARLHAGRFFTEHDSEEAPLVVVINETLARRYFSGKNPVGQHLDAGFGGPREIVGVVADLRNAGLAADIEPEVYVPFFQVLPFSKHLLVRTETPPAELVAQVRAELQHTGANPVVEGITTLDALRADSIARQRFALALIGGWALSGLVLSMVGLYAMLSHVVLQRRAEIAIRLSLGAQRAAILRLVLSQGLSHALIGVALGAVGAFALTGVLRSFLFGVTPTDAATFATATLALLLVALAACLLPAISATRVDPMLTLRAN